MHTVRIVPMAMAIVSSVRVIRSCFPAALKLRTACEPFNRTPARQVARNRAPRRRGSLPTISRRSTAKIEQAASPAEIPQDAAVRHAIRRGRGLPANFLRQAGMIDERTVSLGERPRRRAGTSPADWPPTAACLARSQFSAPFKRWRPARP